MALSLPQPLSWSPPSQPPPHPLLSRVPALLLGDRYLEDTHSQRCVLLQLAVLAGGLGGFPSQAVFVPPAAQVLMDRQTDWEQDEEAQGAPTTPSSSTSSLFSAHSSHIECMFTGHHLEWPWEGEVVSIGLCPLGAHGPASLAPLPPPVPPTPTSPRLCSTHLLSSG